MSWVILVLVLVVLAYFIGRWAYNADQNSKNITKLTNQRNDLKQTVEQVRTSKNLPPILPSAIPEVRGGVSSNATETEIAQLEHECQYYRDWLSQHA